VQSGLFAVLEKNEAGGVITRTSEHALRAVVYLAEREGRGTVRAAEMAENLMISANYLSKILHLLGRRGIVTSVRGRHGGFRLAVPPDEISIASVIVAFDSLAERRECLLGRRECSDLAPCAAHVGWKKVFDTVAEFLNETMISDLRRGEPTVGAAKATRH